MDMMKLLLVLFPDDIPNIKLYWAESREQLDLLLNAKGIEVAEEDIPDVLFGLCHTDEAVNKLFMKMGKIGNWEMVKMMRLDDRITAASLQTCLVSACQSGTLDVVKVLLQDERIGEPSMTALYSAVEREQVETVRLLLEDERFDPSDDENEALKIASVHGYITLVKILLQDERVRSTADKSLMFKYAAQDDHVNVAKLLLLYKETDPSLDDNSLFRDACKRNALGTVKMLLNHPR